MEPEPERSAWMIVAVLVAMFVACVAAMVGLMLLL
jgi:hypothetical protein